MIIRRLAPRQGRRIAFAHITRQHQWRRPYATELNNSQNEAELAAERHIQAALGNEQAQTAVEDTDEPVFLDPATIARERMKMELAQRLQNYYTKTHLKRNQQRHGGIVEQHYRPDDLVANPPRPADVTIELLMASQTHLGHSTSLWNPANSRYIFGIRQGVHIISLEITAAHLRRAAKVVAGVAEKGGIILFVGNRRGHEAAVVRAAELAAPAYHLFERWTPGSITNGEQILGQFAKQVVDEMDRPVEGFEEQMLERGALKPDLVICLNPLDNYVMLHECGLAGIPTIGVIDTDADPSWVTYPIPANDDSLRSISVIAGVLGRAGEEGQQRRRAAAMRGTVANFTPTLEVPIGSGGVDDLEEGEQSAKSADSEPSSIDASGSTELNFETMEASVLDPASEAEGEPLENGSKRESDAEERRLEQGTPDMR